MTVLFVLLAILWLVVGAGAFVFFWTRSFDFTKTEIPMLIIGGLLGPLAIVVGALLHRDTYPEFDRLGKRPGTIVRKRTRPREMD